MADPNMDCNDAVHTMYHYLDGELTPDKRAEMQRHLEACAPCFEAFDFEAELRQLIARKCRDAAPQSLVMRVQQTLRIELEGGGIPPMG
jgi:mycothiol system anti-sigma-R factor